jgi:hypothetical protein
MSKSAFTPLDMLCKRQGVHINSGVLEAGHTGISSAPCIVEPNGLYAAMIEAGHILRKAPDTELVDTAITPPSNKLSYLNRSVAARGLIAILNASLERQPGKSWDTTFQCYGTRAIDACQDAERYFGRVIAQMQTPDKPIMGQRRLIGYQLITDNDNQPIAVRKGMGEPSTLSFTEITINGIPYPAGSIFRADIVDDLERIQKWYKYRTRVYIDTQRRVGVEEVSHIAFRRLSAFAINPLKRRREFPTYGTLASYNAEIRPIRDVTIDQIRAIACAAVESSMEASTNCPQPYLVKSDLQDKHNLSK